MPKRWLSRRGRRQDNSAELDPKKQDFDFAFTSSPSSLPSFNPSTNPPPRDFNASRPTTSSGFIERPFSKKFPIDVLSVRPRTSDCHKPFSGLSSSSRPASRSVDDLIGVAFGSPSHPPMAFCSWSDDLRRGKPERVARKRGPFKERGKQLQPKNWKKIGALFRPRPAPSKRKPLPWESSPLLGEKAEVNKSNESLPNGLPSKLRARVPDEPRRVPPPVPATAPRENHVDSYRETEFPYESTPRADADSTLAHSNVPTSKPQALDRRPVRSSSLPHLQIDIPNTPLDRYTVMFRNVPAAGTSSSLLARRSKTLESLKSTHNSRNNSQSDTEASAEALSSTDIPNQAPSARRLTSPTSVRPPAPFAGLTTSTSSPTVSKYSLFPASSNPPAKVLGRIPFNGQLRRSATSPARLSPMTEQFPAKKPLPLNAKRDQTGASPEEVTASTDRSGPWSSAHSFKSSISSSTTMEEIFFDIKSLRDSRGVEDGLFVMTRPDSTAMQLARTRSKLNGSSRATKRGAPAHISAASTNSTSTPNNEVDDKHFSVKSVNSAIFDEVIAAVERLASPDDTEIQLPKVNVVPARTDDTRSQVRSAVESPATAQDVSKQKLPSRLDQFVCTIPSPVLEEPSPRSTQSATFNLSREASPVIPLPTKRVAAIKRIDLPIEESPTIPQEPPPRMASPSTAVDDKPPPVPKKDAKFIPISRFATKNTLSAVERAGVRVKHPRPGRSATETQAISKAGQAMHQETEDSRRLKPERSKTHPVPQLTSASVPKSANTTPTMRRAGSPTTETPRQSPLQQVNASPSRTLPAKPAATIPSSNMDLAQTKVNVGSAGITTITAIIRPVPAAEVAVARSVSLSRKQSARVLVPGPKLLARRAAAAAEEEAKAKVAVADATVAASNIEIKVEEPQGAEAAVNRREEIERDEEREEKAKLEILEKRALNPIVVEGQRGHKPGVSMNLLVETA